MTIRKKRNADSKNGTTKKRKRSKWTSKRLTIIGLIVAVIIGIPSFITIFPLIPHVELQVNLISNGEVHPFFNTNRTIITGLNVTIPTTISNTGNVPIHIAACDVFMTNEGKPTNLLSKLLVK